MHLFRLNRWCSACLTPTLSDGAGARTRPSIVLPVRAYPPTRLKSAIKVRLTSMNKNLFAWEEVAASVEALGKSQGESLDGSSAVARILQ